MRSAHQFERGLDLAPDVRFFAMPIGLARLRPVGGLGERLVAACVEHLAGIIVHLHFIHSCFYRHGVVLLLTQDSNARDGGSVAAWHSLAAYGAVSSLC